MDRVWKSGAIGTPPPTPGSFSNGYASAGNPSLSVPATQPGAYWFHMITEEVRAVIVAAGVTPSATVLTQMRDALTTLFPKAADLADTSDVAKGDAQVGVNNGDPNEVARTLHYWIKASRRNLCNFLVTSEIDDILSGTGSIDVTAKFSNAIAAAGAAGGSKGAFLDLPQGLITVGASNASVACAANKVWVEGQGRATRVQTTSGTADIFLVGDGTNEISGFSFRNFDVWSTVVKSAGAVFNMRFATDAKLENVRAGSVDDLTVAGGSHHLYDGVYWNGYSQVEIEGGEIVCANEGVRARGKIDQSFGAELWLYGGLRIYKAAAGVHLGGACGGVRLGDIDVSLCGIGALIDQALQATYNREAFFSGECSIDSSTIAGVKINQAAASVARFLFRNTWLSGGNSGAHGLWIAAANGARVFGEVMAYANAGDGVRCDDATTYLYIGGEYDLNGGYGINPTVTTSRMLIDPGTKYLANTAGDFNSTFNSRPSVYLKTGANKGVQLNPDGAIEITAATPYVDFKNTDAQDYVGRIALAGTNLALTGVPTTMQNYTVGTLPSATGSPYMKAFVSDANATTFNSVVAGGGANKVPVFSDGTNWRIG